MTTPDKCPRCGSKPILGKDGVYQCGSLSPGDLFVSDLCDARKRVAILEILLASEKKKNNGLKARLKEMKTALAGTEERIRFHEAARHLIGTKVEVTPPAVLGHPFHGEVISYDQCSDECEEVRDVHTGHVWCIANNWAKEVEK